MKTSKNGFQMFVRKNTDLSVLLLLFAVIFTAMAILDGNFLKAANFQSIGFQLPVLGLLTLSMMVAMLTGGINLSIIASTNLITICMAKLMSAMYVEGTDPTGVIALTIAAGLLLSILAGLLNGIIISVFHITPIIATLSTQMLFDGISTMVTKGYIVSGIPSAYLSIATKSVAGIPIPFVIFLVCVAALAILLVRTGLGKEIYMYGSNAVASRFSGVNDRNLTLMVYAISNLIAGIAGVIMLARFNSASVGYSTAFLLETVLICVLGGVDPNGGRGNVVNVCVALFILQLVSNGFTLLGISQFLSTAIWGVLLIAVIALRAEKKR